MEVTVLISQRQITNGTMAPSGDDRSSSLSFEAWLATYWYILLIVLAVLIVLCVLICACVLKKTYPRSHSYQPRSHVPKSSNSSPDRSVQSHQSSIPTMPSLSADSTPIPSPHSSQHSDGIFNGRNRRTSPRLSSTSSDTLRPDIRSVSSNSSASLMAHSPTRQQERNSPMERRGSLPRRTHPSPMVRVTSMPDVKNGGLRSAPSTVSVESSSNGRSGVSYKFQPSYDSNTFVEVGVTVHTPGDPDKAVRIATAAALAESARKLAQEAASFIDTGDENIHLPPLPRGNRPYHPGSGRSSSFSLSQPSYTPTHSHPIPITTANLDNPSTAPGRVGGGILRGEHYPIPHYPVHPSHRPVYNHHVNDSEYNNHRVDYEENNYSYDGHLPFQMGRPYRSSLDSNYNRQEVYPRGKPYRSSLDSNYNRQEVHLPQTRDRISSISSARETSFNGRHVPLSPGTGETNTSHRSKRYPPESNYSRKIPFHLTAAGRRQSAPTFNRRLESIKRVANERGGGIHPRVIQVPVEIEMPSEKPTLNEIEIAPSNNNHDARHPIAYPLEVTPSLTQSPSTSTGLSSTHSSQLEDPQSQENPSETSQVNNEVNGVVTLNQSDSSRSKNSLSSMATGSLTSTSSHCAQIDSHQTRERYKGTQRTDQSANIMDSISTRPPFSKESSNESEESIEATVNYRKHSVSSEPPVNTTRLTTDDKNHSTHGKHRRNGLVGNSNNLKHYSSSQSYQSKTVGNESPKEHGYISSNSFQPVSSSRPSSSNATIDVTVNV